MPLPRSGFWRSQTAGYLCIVLSVLNWSGNFVAARGLAETMPPATLNLYRWALAAAIMLPFGLGPLWRERAVVRAALPELCLLALVGVSLFDTLIFLAGQTSSALNMSLLSTLSPVLTALAARQILGERCPARMMVGIAVSTAGVVLLVTGGDLGRLAGFSFARGDLLILVTCAMSAAYNIVVRRLAGRMGQRTMLTAMCLLGALFLVPLWGLELARGQAAPPMTPALWWTLAYLAVCASLLCYLLWNVAVEIIGATRTTLFYNVLPVTSGLLAWWLLDEPATWAQLAAGAVIVVGILVSLRPGAGAPAPVSLPGAQG